MTPQKQSLVNLWDQTTYEWLLHCDWVRKGRSQLVLKWVRRVMGTHCIPAKHNQTYLCTAHRTAFRNHLHL